MKCVKSGKDAQGFPASEAGRIPRCPITPPPGTPRATYAAARYPRETHAAARYPRETHAAARYPRGMAASSRFV